MMSGSRGWCVGAKDKLTLHSVGTSGGEKNKKGPPGDGRCKSDTSQVHLPQNNRVVKYLPGQTLLQFFCANHPRLILG